MYRLALPLLLLSSALPAQEKVLNLSLSDFTASRSITILQGQYHKIHLENMYAQQVFIFDSSDEKKRMKSCTAPDPMKTQNTFDLDISCLENGSYTLQTSACYYIASLQLNIVQLPVLKMSKKKIPNKC